MRGANILNLGVKELRGLARDPMLVVLILYAFTLSIYTASTSMPETLNKAAIAIVDEDQSPVSSRILTAFYRTNLVVPAGVPVEGAMQARETLGGAVAVSETLEPALGEQLMQAAAHAFDGGVVITSLIGAALMITAAVIAAVSLRGTRNRAKGAS